MTTTRARLAILILALGVVAALACQSGAPVPPAAERVILVSFDGLGADLAWRWLDDGTLGDPAGLAGFAARGRSARRLRPVNPTLTAVNHISLATGRLPAGHGIVSNSFRTVGSPFPKSEYGFSAEVSGRPLWSVARRQGKRSAVLLWPGADATAVERMGDLGVVWPTDPLLAAAVVELDPAAAVAAPELAANDGLPALGWQLPLPGDGSHSHGLEVVVSDGVADGVARYDQVAVRLAGEPSYELHGERSWFQVTVAAAARGDLRAHPYGAWSKVLRVDRVTGAVRLYRGAFWRTIAYPATFQDELDAAFGPWPGPPDDDAIRDWWLNMDEGVDLDTYLEQGERFDRFLDDLAGHVLTNQDVDLVLAYHATVDEYLHSSLIVDPDQWAYSEGTAFAAAEGLKRVGRSVDRSVAALWQALDPTRDLMVVVSDHGLVPTTDEIAVNRALADAGLVTVEEVGGRARIAATSPLMATTSGACAHLYLNQIGREPTGVVAAADGPRLLAQAARVLADLAVDGEPVVERVVTRAEAKALGLGHPNCGDLVIFLAPRYSARASLTGEVITPSRMYAQHGHLAEHDALAGVFFARGAGLEAKRLDELRVTDVAPMVAGWLGLSWTGE